MVADGVEINGQVEFEHLLRIDGRVKGKLVNLLHLTRNGLSEGSAKASVIIGKNGLFIGNVGCDEEFLPSQSQQQLQQPQLQVVPNHSIKYLVMEGGEVVGDIYAEEIVLQGDAVIRAQTISCKNITIGPHCSVFANLANGCCCLLLLIMNDKL